MRQERRVREQYDRFAAGYDRRWRRYLRGTLGYMADRLALNGTEEVLDVGCGTGELERMLTDRSPALRMTGVDLSAGMLEAARAKLGARENVQFVQAGAGALPFPERRFDVVVTASAFHYFGEPEATLREMARVLKPSGELVLLDWCRDFLFWRISDVALRAFDPAHRGCYTEAEMQRMLEASGWTVLEQERRRVAGIYGMMLFRAGKTVRD